MTPPLPPRSPGLPLVGETLAFLRDRAGFVAQRRARYGPLFRTRLFGVEVYVAAAPEVSAALLRGEHRSFEATWPTSTRRLLGPATLATQEGELHRRRRRMLAQAFGPRALAAYAPRIDAMIGEYLARWREGRPIVWADELRAMTFDVATTLFTGARAGAGSGLMRDFEAYAAGLFMPALAIPGTPFFAALRARRRLLGHIEGVVAGRRGAPRAAGDPDVLDLLLDARDEDGAGLDEREIGEQILLLLFAGHETLTSALTSLCLLLSRHPEVLARARAEVDGAEPADTLPYLERVLCEVMRRLPPVGGGFRRCVADCELAGYRVPAGAYVLYGILSTHLDPEVHPDPERFDPERFPAPGEPCAAGQVSPQGLDGRYIPFGGGPRVCLGMEFARLEMRLFAARLLRECEWRVLPRQDLRLRMLPVPKPRSGLRVVVSARG